MLTCCPPRAGSFGSFPGTVQGAVSGIQPHGIVGGLRLARVPSAAGRLGKVQTVEWQRPCQRVSSNRFMYSMKKIDEVCNARARGVGLRELRPAGVMDGGVGLPNC